MTWSRIPDRPPGTDLAWLAFTLGVLHAAVSVYWGFGGTWLLETVGGALEVAGRAGDPVLRAVVWASAGLKLVAAAVGLLAIAPGITGVPHRLIRLVGWTAAIILILYGGMLTVVGLLVQIGLVPRAAEADDTALAWHAFFWDPWFLLWGLALAGALWRSRRPTANPPPR